MRSPSVRHAMRFYTMAVVLMSLSVTLAYAQSRARTSSRGQRTAPPATTGNPAADHARRMADRHTRSMQEMQQEIERMRQQTEENRNRSIRQALGASDDQWQQVQPKLHRIERLKAEADVAAIPGPAGTFQGAMFGGGGFAGGGMGSGSMEFTEPNGATVSQASGWGGSWSMGPKSVLEMTEGEALCQELQQLLQEENAPPAQIAEKVAALRKVRA